MFTMKTILTDRVGNISTLRAILVDRAESVVLLSTPCGEEMLMSLFSLLLVRLFF